LGLCVCVCVCVCVCFRRNDVTQTQCLPLGQFL